jgi:hypothetical protein
MVWHFVPLADVQHDPEAIVSRLLEVADAAGVDTDDDQDDDAGTGVPWSVKASRRLLGDQGVWEPGNQDG